MNRLKRWMKNLFKDRLEDNTIGVPIEDVQKHNLEEGKQMVKKELEKMQVNFGDKDKYITGYPDFTPAQVEIIPQEQIKEIGYFNRANNLIAEYYGEAPPISSNNLSAWEKLKPSEKLMPIQQPYMGYMILALDEEDLRLKMETISKGFTDGFMTDEEFNRRFYDNRLIPTYAEIPEDKWTGEDADKLNQISESEKERLLKLTQTITHIISGFPNNSNTDPHDEQRPENPDILSK